MRAIGDESASLQRALELLPGTLRKANTTFVNLRTHARRPRPARRGVEAEHEGARAVLPRAAPAGARRAAHGRRPARADPRARAEQRPDRADREAAAAGGAHRDRLPARDPGARPLRPGGRVRARLHARPRRPGSRSSARWPRTTTPTATTRASCRCSARRSLDRAQNKLVGDPAAAALAGFERGTPPDLPGRRHPAAPDGSSPVAVPTAATRPADPRPRTHRADEAASSTSAWPWRSCPGS